MSRDRIATLWDSHSHAAWPLASSPLEGQLMTLDTVIGGCAVFYLDDTTPLDDRRRAILEDCLTDLDALMDELTGDSVAYVQRLRDLADALVQSNRPA